MELQAFGTTVVEYFVTQPDGLQLKDGPDFLYAADALERAKQEVSQSGEHLKLIWAYLQFQRSQSQAQLQAQSTWTPMLSPASYASSLGALYESMRNVQSIPGANGSSSRLDVATFLATQHHPEIPASPDKAWINANSDYTFIVLGRGHPDSFDAMAVGSEKPSAAHGGYLNVVYDDGHVELKSVQDAETALAETEKHCPAGAAEAAGASKLTVAIIPKGEIHSYWKSVHAGAQQAADELGVNIVWKAPLTQRDREQQIALVEQFQLQNINGIVLAPLDKTALVRSVKNAADRKIPVVIIDSPLDGTVGADFVSLVAADNKKAGSAAGDKLAKLLNGKGKLVLLRYMAGSASTEQREQGFLDEIKKHPDIQVISDNQEAGSTTDTAKDKSMQMLDTLRQADGIFCPNESSTLGMLQALRQANLLGKDKKVKFVGFDVTPPLVDAVKAGDIDALVAQNPHKMGYLGVKTCVDYIRGQKIDQNIDVGVELVTPENFNTPAIQNLLNGDVRAVSPSDGANSDANRKSGSDGRAVGSYIGSRHRGGSTIDGINITDLTPGGPMQTYYGLRAGDIVTEIGGTSVKILADPGGYAMAKSFLDEAYANHQRLVVDRNGVKLTLP